MAIDEQGGFARGSKPFRIDQRMALGRDQLGLQTHRGQIVADKRCRSVRIGIMIGLGTDTGDPDQILELRLEVITMLFEICVHWLVCHE